MATTIKKTSISITGRTFGNSLFLGDGATYEALKAHKTAEAKDVDGERTVLIPFHAVKAYRKTVNSEEATKADAYCE